MDISRNHGSLPALPTSGWYKSVPKRSIPPCPLTGANAELHGLGKERRASRGAPSTWWTVRASKNIRVRAVRAELRAAPSVLRTSSGRTVHGDRRPAGPYGPAECMNGRRPVWHGWAGPNRAPCLLPIAPWSLHPYVSRESAADRTWLVERRLLLKVMTGPSRSMYGTTRVSKRRLNSTVDERGGARHANPRFTAVAVVGWSSSSEAHDGR